MTAGTSDGKSNSLPAEAKPAGLVCKTNLLLLIRNWGRWFGFLADAVIGEIRVRLEQISSRFRHDRLGFEADEVRQPGILRS